MCANVNECHGVLNKIVSFFAAHRRHCRRLVVSWDLIFDRFDVVVLVVLVDVVFTRFINRKKKKMFSFRILQLACSSRSH